MPKGTKTCKVCGCEYPYCKTNRPAGVFRYQDVACSPEHGAKYLKEILASRSSESESPLLESVTKNTDNNASEESTENTIIEKRSARRRKAKELCEELPEENKVVLGKTGGGYAILDELTVEHTSEPSTSEEEAFDDFAQE